VHNLGLPLWSWIFHKCSWLKIIIWKKLPWQVHSSKHVGGQVHCLEFLLPSASSALLADIVFSAAYSNHIPTTPIWEKKTLWDSKLMTYLSYEGLQRKENLHSNKTSKQLEHHLDPELNRCSICEEEDSVKSHGRNKTQSWCWLALLQYNQEAYMLSD